MALRLLLALLLLVPGAGACSLAYQPFDQPSWGVALHYVDGASLRRVDGHLDTRVADGFFLSYGTAGDLVLVGGQTGLGADCSGTGWLRLQRGTEVLWEKAGEARVWNDPAGPIAQHGGAVWRLQGTELVRLPAQVPEGAYVSGWTPEGEPVYRGDGAIVVGALQLPREDVSQFEPFVTRNAQATGIAFAAGGEATLVEVAGGEARSISWPVEEHFSSGVAWADGWYVVAGRRAFLVRDGVTDLGVADAVSVGRQGKKAVVFTEEGYTLFEGTAPVAAARRMEGVWVPAPAGQDRSQPVAGATWSDADAQPGPASPSTTTGGDGRVLDIPAPGLLLALAALALALARRRA